MQSPTLAEQGKARLENSEADQSEQRPAPEALRVPAVDPKLEAVLNDWFKKTGNIQKLQGQHRRWTFEPVFQVAKISIGKFYYEAPDRGRIDLTSENPPALAKLDVDPVKEGVQILQPGTNNVFTVKEDVGESWICDGTQIVRIDESQKTFEVVPIPPEHRGRNIMDGPLPFLFGLPPEKAKQRYNMTLRASQQPNSIYLEVLPLQRNDASLWQKADVMLDATTYLPTAVRLLDNKGQGTTLYTFNDHEINAINILKIFGAGDPFKPNLFGYK
ncbi:MAG: hypothetical protein M3552_12340, partial [Planctomycetota bacterium]|nr:hypothetical protein [Planctomycetota bacterium]